MNPLRFPVSLVLLTVLVLVVGAGLEQNRKADAVSEDRSGPYRRHPASLYLGQAGEIDLDDTIAVFSYVFSQLDPSVTVYPTENYLYFRFLSGTRDVWGNLRLSPTDRDNGMVHIGYYELPENVESLESVKLQHRLLGIDEGIEVAKHDDFYYSLTHRGKTVLFVLNQLAQTPPMSFTLLPDEEVLFRLHDESNVRFFLLFNKATNSFLYVADEDDKPLDEVAWLTDDVLMDMPSGFVFFVDAADAGRKILIGVRDRDVRQNTYFDGPFDQLADNFIGPDSKLAEYIQLAYPYTAGQINRFGVFNDEPDTRVAILAYRTYDSADELLAAVASCKADTSGAELYACMTLDEGPTLQAASAAALSQPPPEDIDGVVPNRQTHLAGISFAPQGSVHNGGVTYAHYTNVTWRPRNTRHDVRTTRYHFTNITFVPGGPGGSGHNAYHTYVHYAGVTFRPTGTQHTTPTTWLHDAMNTFAARTGGFLPGLPGVPGLP